MQIISNRLILRPLTLKDLDTMTTDIFSHPEVMQYSLDGIKNRKYTKEFIKSQIYNQRKYNFSCWAIVYKKNNQVIGYCGIMPQLIDRVQEFELGYRLSYGYWKMGLGSEAASLALDYAKNTLKLCRIISIIESANEASVKIALKNGFVPEKTNTTWGGFPIQIYKTVFN